MSGPFKNEDGRVSGAKMILLTACGLTIAWLLRDLAVGRDLSEAHTVLLGMLLVVGLINRMSARGRFRLKFGRDGAEMESDNEHRSKA